MTPNTNKNTDSVDIPTVDNNQPMIFVQERLKEFAQWKRLLNTFNLPEERPEPEGNMCEKWLIQILTEAIEVGKRMEREKIINHFKGTWLGDDYHGEAIESEIRALTTKISND